MKNEARRGCGGAEAVLSLQPRSSISVAYHPHFGPHNDLLLLELDEKFVPEVLRERVTLRGLPDEDAVLCTNSKTYAIKFVGTSNSVFLIPPSDYLANSEERDGDNDVASVIKIATGNMELMEVVPRLDKLKSLLLENPYGLGEEIEMETLGNNENSRKGLYKWDDLVNVIQASDDELRTGLEALSAVEIDGYWRIVDEKYMDVLLRLLLHNSVLHDWSMNALNEDEVRAVLESDGYPSKLANHCLRVYGTEVFVEMGKRAWKLDERWVCIHFARQILKDGKRKMENLMKALTEKMPEGMQARFDFLEGEVLTEKVGIETWVQAFSVRSLPSNPAERFSMLFKQRAKWAWNDLEPYIRDLKVPGLSSEGLLLKYTRRAQPKPNAEPVFSAR